MVPTLVENPNILVYLFVNFFENIIMIMIEIQYSSTALLLLANPRILHQNSGTVCLLTYLYCLKRRRFVASYIQLVMQ